LLAAADISGRGATSSLHLSQPFSEIEALVRVLGDTLAIIVALGPMVDDQAMCHIA
jgi:hypothetical protein